MSKLMINFPSWIFRLGALFTLVFLASVVSVYSQSDLPSGNSILQGSISIDATKQLEEADKIQPGSQVKLKLHVENVGKETNSPGTVYIRFAFGKPLSNQPNSVLFQTEKVPLPSIEPGKFADITFNSMHQWPCLIDFIRYDWPMREYQAIIEGGPNEKVIGTLAITFSSYYYPGIKKEYPVEVPAL